MYRYVARVQSADQSLRGSQIRGSDGSRNAGNTAFHCKGFCCDFVAKKVYIFRSRTDEYQPFRFHRHGEIRIFAEKPIARMHSVTSRFNSEFDDPRDNKISPRAPGPYGNGLVSTSHMQTAIVLVRKYRDGRDPDFCCSAGDADGDFASVRDK